VRDQAYAATGTRPLAEALLAAAPLVWRHARLATKPLLMPALAARFVKAPRGDGFRHVLAAQAFSWGGDIALIGNGRRTFLTGLGSFLVAHLAYASAYRSRSSAPVLGTPGRRRFLAAGTVAASGMALAAGREDRALAVPVAAYGATLAIMVAAAAAVDPDKGRGRVLAGASLFMLSDTLIGVHMFFAGNNSRALEAAVMGTYTLGQWCIGDGMAHAA
jgi:uncharacterized membrane protein YhhN